MKLRILRDVRTASGLVLMASVLWLPARAEVDFTREIAPILQGHCLECHGPEKQKGRLRLDSKADLLKGGSGGPAVKAGDAAGSELHRRITLPKDNDEHMPPTGDPLTPAQIETLMKWIQAGAAWPDGVVLQPSAVTTATPSVAAASLVAPGAPAKPPVPAPELPKSFQPSATETEAIAALAKQGVEVRPIAQNVPWHEINLRPLGTSVTDETIAPLKNVASLIEARLGGTQVTDAGLAALGSLPHLQVLGLELTGVTDAGIARLAGLSNLVSLNLYGTAVSDAGLTHLRGMKHLRNLYLWQSKVTPEGVARLQEALPGLNINTGVDAAATNPPAPSEKADQGAKPAS